MLSPLIFNIKVQVLAKEVKQEQTESNRAWKRKKTKLPLSIDDIFAYIENLQVSYYNLRVYQCC